MSARQERSRSGEPKRAARRPRRGADAATTLVFVLAAWEVLSRAGVWNVMAAPPPSHLAAEAARLLASGVLVANAWGSLLRVLAGFALAALLGVVAGIACGVFPALGRRVAPGLELLRPIPPIAWIPIAILWLGLGNPSAIFIVAVGAFFPIFLNTYAGILAVDQSHVNAARCLGAGRRLIVTDVLLPAALPRLLMGLRVGVGIAWTSVIAAEMVGAQEGLGYALQLNRIMLETEAVMVNMISIGLIGWGMNLVVERLAARLTRWDTQSVGAWERRSEETVGL